MRQAARAIGEHQQGALLTCAPHAVRAGRACEPHTAPSWLRSCSLPGLCERSASRCRRHRPSRCAAAGTLPPARDRRPRSRKKAAASLLPSPRMAPAASSAPWRPWKGSGGVRCGPAEAAAVYSRRQAEPLAGDPGGKAAGVPCWQAERCVAATQAGRRQHARLDGVAVAVAQVRCVLAVRLHKPVHGPCARDVIRLARPALQRSSRVRSWRPAAEPVEDRPASCASGWRSVMSMPHRGQSLKGCRHAAQPLWPQSVITTGSKYSEQHLRGGRRQVQGAVGMQPRARAPAGTVRLDQKWIAHAARTGQCAPLAEGQRGRTARSAGATGGGPWARRSRRGSAPGRPPRPAAPWRRLAAAAAGWRLRWGCRRARWRGPQGSARRRAMRQGCRLAALPRPACRGPLGSARWAAPAPARPRALGCPGQILSPLLPGPWSRAPRGSGPCQRDHSSLAALGLLFQPAAGQST